MEDQYAGRGGSYIIENGERRLVHNTQGQPDNQVTAANEPQVKEHVEEIGDVQANA